MRTILVTLAILAGLMLSSCAKPTDQKTAELRQAAEKGDPVEQYNLGVMYDNGYGEWFDEAIIILVTLAILAGWVLRFRETLTDQKIAELRQAAESGDADADVAQFKLGVMYYFGYGVRRDHAEAAKLLGPMVQAFTEPLMLSKSFRKTQAAYVHQKITELRQSAENGDADAQFTLGMYYQYGIDVRKNCAEAVKWYKLAAEQGKPGHQSILGEMYYKGECVRQDYGEAMRWCRPAALEGNARAQLFLGFMYYRGKGVMKKDYGAAMSWYQLAAEQGDANAQYYLGAMYAKGKGVRQDKRQAKEWMGKACDNGLQAGCDKYRELNEEGY